MTWTKPYYGITHLEGMRAGFYGCVCHRLDEFDAHLVGGSSPVCRTFRYEPEAKGFLENEALLRGAFPDA
jgi:hypothetical protein